MFRRRPPPPVAPKATPVPITLGTSEITSGADSSMCLDHGGGNRTRGNVINIYQCNDTWGGEVWTVEYDGTVRIQNYCLDVHGGSTTKGAQVLLNSCNGGGSPGEAWQPQSDGSLLNLNSGMCLGINGVVRNGTTLFIWPCDGDAAADLNLFGFLWDNDGRSWPGTETAELNEATQGSALDALVANMGDSHAMC